MYTLGVTMRQQETLSKNIRVPEICQQRGISKTTLYKKIKEGKFPAPQCLSSTFQWDREVLEEWFKAGAV
jgi:excisionase family DNA binding protein